MTEILCKCNEKASYQIVKKDGPTKGKMFYSCGNNRKCNFFQWEDKTSNPNKYFSNKPKQQGNDTAPAVVVPKCPTHLCPCVRKIVSSNTSQNKGKFFFVCPNSTMENKCYFLWEDAFFPDDSNSCKSTDGGFKYIVNFQIVADDILHVSFSSDLVEKMKKIQKDLPKIQFGKPKSLNLDKNYENFTIPIVHKGELKSKLEGLELGIRIQDIPDQVTKLLREYPKIDTTEQDSSKIFQSIYHS